MAGLLPALLRSGLAPCRAAPLGAFAAHGRAFTGSPTAAKAEPEPALEPEGDPARWSRELGAIRTDWTCVLAPPGQCCPAQRHGWAQAACSSAMRSLRTGAGQAHVCPAPRSRAEPGVSGWRQARGG